MGIPFDSTDFPIFESPSSQLPRTGKPVGEGGDEGRGGARFTRDANGVITDSSTNLQWLEGPDQEVNWNKAQAWINSLGKGWRTPTRGELKGIYIANSTRMGGASGSSGPWNLRLDPVFLLDKAYRVWADSNDSSSAWIFFFGNAHEGWGYCDDSNWLYRAFAVRSR
jgi:hypothetical protein